MSIFKRCYSRVKLELEVLIKKYYLAMTSYCSALLSKQARRVKPSMGLTQASGQCAPALSNKVYPYTDMLVILTFITSATHYLPTFSDCQSLKSACMAE